MIIQVQIGSVAISGLTKIGCALPVGFGVTGDGPVYSIGYRSNEVATARIEDGLIFFGFIEFDLSNLFREKLVEKWPNYGTLTSTEIAIPLHEVILQDADIIACSLPVGYTVREVGPEFVIMLRALQVATARIVPVLLPVIEFNILEDDWSIQLKEGLTNKYKALFLKS